MASMPLCRFHFLEEGVKDCAGPGDSEKCPVCLEDSSDSDFVQILLCKHIVDRKCLKRWLRDYHSCPTCHKILCKEYDEASETRCVLKSRVTLEAFGIPQFWVLDRSLLQLPPEPRFNYAWDVAHLGQGATAKIDIKVLGPALNHEANFEIAKAFVNGSYQAHWEHRDFRLIVGGIYDYLKTVDGQEMNVADLMVNMATGLAILKAGNTIEPESLKPKLTEVDLRVGVRCRAMKMVCYVAYLAWKEKDMARQREGESCIIECRNYDSYGACGT